MAKASAISRVVFVSFLMAVVSAGADVNSWTNSAGGKWEDPSWSLGVLPAKDQSVVITNEGTKTVTIDANTAGNFPATLSASNITIAAENSLLIDSLGSNAMLNVAAGFLVSKPGSVINNDSTVHGGFNIQGGSAIQNGGLCIAPSGVFCDLAGAYYLTNGTLRTDAGISLGEGLDGHFFQSDSDVTCASLALNAYGSSYEMNGGQLTVSDGVGIGMSPYTQFQLSAAKFHQTGGTTRVSGAFSVQTFRGQASATIEGGTLQTGEVNVRTGIDTAAVFITGTNIVTNAITISGGGYHVTATPAVYWMDGFVSARRVRMDGDAQFTINGTATITENVVLGSDYSFDIGFLDVNGYFTCSDLVCSNAGADITVDTGGAFIVSNMFSFGGSYAPVYRAYRFPQFTFEGAAFRAKNIEMSAEWTVSRSSFPGLFSNPGYFKFSGILDVNDGTVQLGRFILATPTSHVIFVGPTINFTGSQTVLTFADSSAETWAPSQFLFVTNWNGSLAGGGNHQLKFGSDRSGLNAAQVAAIRFLNPAGLSAGTYTATMLDTGEIVPNAADKKVISTSAAPTEGGTTTGDGVYDLESSVTVQAIAEPCYNFVGWTENGKLVSTFGTYSFIATRSRNLVANFQHDTYLISTTASPPNTGLLKGGGTNDCGSTVTVTAAPYPNSGYLFNYWSDNGNIVSTNPVYVLTVDGTHNLTAFFAPSNNVSFTTSGNGRILPNLNGITLQNDRHYTVSAVPAKGWLFSDWSGDISSTRSMLTFLMTDGLHLQANFVTNPFVALAGSYEGLALNPDNPGTQPIGYLRLTLSSSGFYSGQVTSTDGTRSFSGQFDINLHSLASVIFPNATSLSLDMNLNPDTFAINGTVQNNSGATSQIFLQRAAVSAADLAGKYTLVLSNDLTLGNAPACSGCGSMNIASTGTVTLSAKLSSNSSISGAYHIGQDGTFPIYRLINGGTVFGWLSPSNASPLLWVDGGMASTTALISHYTPPPRGTRIINVTHPIVTFSGGDLIAQEQGLLNLSSANVVRTVSSSVKSLRFSLNAGTGTFAGYFLDPTTHRIAQFQGAILQDQNLGWGFFVSGKQSGLVYFGSP